MSYVFRIRSTNLSYRMDQSSNGQSLSEKRNKHSKYNYFSWQKMSCFIKRIKLGEMITGKEKIENFGIFSENVNFFENVFWKYLETARGRAKILVEINPSGHKPTPTHLFLAKNVISSKDWNGSKIWSFFNENKIENVGFCRKNWSNITVWPGRHLKQ